MTLVLGVCQQSPRQAEKLNVPARFAIVPWMREYVVERHDMSKSAWLCAYRSCTASIPTCCCPCVPCTWKQLSQPLLIIYPSHFLPLIVKSSSTSGMSAGVSASSKCYARSRTMLSPRKACCPKFTLSRTMLFPELRREVQERVYSGASEPHEFQMLVFVLRCSRISTGSPCPEIVEAPKSRYCRICTFAS